MTAYVEAYETVRDHLMPGGWESAGAGERYPGDYRGRALLAVRALEEYVDRTWAFWALEPELDMGSVLGRYNSLWDALYKPPTVPEPAPEDKAAAGSGGPTTVAGEAATLSEAVLDASCDACGHQVHPGRPCPACFFEEDQPTEEILAVFEAGEKGMTGASTASGDAGPSALPESPEGGEPITAVLPAVASSPNKIAEPGPLARLEVDQ